MAGHGLEGHAEAKASCDAINHSIALVGMLPDSVAVQKGRNLRESTTALIAMCRCNSKLFSARQHGS
jgi:hypothetical protein